MPSPDPAEPQQKTVYTFCRYCLASCGVEVTVDNGRIVKIAPDKQNPHSWQDFCAKGRTAAELVEHPRRITRPMRRVGDTYVEATWDEAISDIARRMSAIVDAGGPDAVASYTGNPAGFSSSNLLFMTGWLDGIGSHNRFYVGSVDQNALHVVAEAMYGSQLFVPVSDVDNCDYFLLVGTNPAVSAWNWVETVPAGWKRTLARQRDGARIVVVDPIRTETADKADLHLAIRPGQDWALLLAMVKIILDEHLEHRGDCAELADGLSELRALVADADLDDLAARCEIPRPDIERVAREFATAPRAMAVTRTGVSLHEAGTIGEWLGHVLNVITGRMDRPGGRRYERGYVNALRLAALAKPADHRSRIQGRALVAGHHGLDELPDEITTPGPGQVRALVINAGNPVVSGPHGAKLDAALRQLDLLVAIDLVQRESHRHAHWLLPAVHWLERDDLLALTSGLHDEPYVHYGRRATDPPAEAREEWRFFLELTLAMKRPFLGIKGMNGFVRATQSIAKFAHTPWLAFGPHWIDRMLVASSRRISWRGIMTHPHGWVLGEREFGRMRNALRTPDKRIRVAPPQFLARTYDLMAQPSPHAPPDQPLLLVGRRHRHSMNSWLNDLPGLHPGGKGNDVVLNPLDAEALGISDGDRVRLFSGVGEVELLASVNDRPRRGVVIIDHGWGSRVFDPRGVAPPISHGTNRNLLVDGSGIDPLSQTPALSSTYVGVERITGQGPTSATTRP